MDDIDDDSSTGRKIRYVPASQALDNDNEVWISLARNPSLDSPRDGHRSSYKADFLMMMKLFIFILMFCVIFGISSAMIDHRPFTPIWLRCRVIPDYTLPVRV